MTKPATFTFRWSLTDRQERVLEHLRSVGEPRTALQVAEALALTQRQASRTLDQLVNTKLVVKRQDSKHRGFNRYRTAPEPKPREGHHAASA